MPFAQIAKHFIAYYVFAYEFMPLEWEDQKLLDTVTTKKPVRTLERNRYSKQNQNN